MIESRYALGAQVLLEQEDENGDVIVIDGRAGTMSASNMTAALLLERLERGASADDLAALLVEKFGIEPQDASEDVRGFLDQLTAMGLVDVAA